MVPAGQQLQRLLLCGDFFFRTLLHCVRTICKSGKTIWGTAWRHETHACNAHTSAHSQPMRLRRGATAAQTLTFGLRWVGFRNCDGPRGSKRDAQHTDDANRCSPRRSKGTQGPRHQQQQKPNPHKEVLHLINFDARVEWLASGVGGVWYRSGRTCKAVGRWIGAHKVSRARKAQSKGGIRFCPLGARVARLRGLETNRRSRARGASQAADLCAFGAQDTRTRRKRHGRAAAVLRQRTRKARRLRGVGQRSRRTRTATGHAQ